MDLPLQPGASREVAAPRAATDVGRCDYCGAPLSEFFYFCLGCGTPYKSIDTVVAPLRPRQLTEGELVEIKAPHVRTLFWSYFAVIVGVGIATSVVFREDRPDLQILLVDIALLLTTCVWGTIHRRSLGSQLRRFGFNHAAAFIGMAALVPLLAVNYFYHRFLIEVLGAEDADLLSQLREAGVGPIALVVTFCLFPAVLEEIAYRGLMQHWLQTALKPWRALVMASFLFGLMHFSVLSLPYLMSVGMLLGWVKQKTGSLYPSMLMHFVHNFVVIEYFG